MKKKMFTHKSSALASLALSVAFAGAANADVFTHAIAPEFTPTNATQTVHPTFGTIGDTSFYNPDMGFNGWMHTSAWGYAKLKKGIPVTIDAVATDTNFHPAIAVWQFAGSAKVECAPGLGIGVGPYTAWSDVYVKKITDTTGTHIDAKCKQAIDKSLTMTFVANGVDRDGWDVPADLAAAVADADKYDNSMINRLLDGALGKVSVTFTPPATGFYKFVVGGMHPNAAVGTSTSVDVTVHFPQ